MTKRFRYSLRFLIVLTVFVGAFVGWFTVTILDHVAATKKLRSLGVIQIDGFEEPIGPNWLYLKGAEIPRNGHFKDFRCPVPYVAGYFEYWIIEKSLSSEELNLLSVLFHFQKLRIVESSIPDGWVEIIFDCDSLRHLEIQGMAISQKDVEAISKLEIEVLSLQHVSISNVDKLKECLSNMHSLETLALSNTGLDKRDIELIQKQLPSCEVLWSDKTKVPGTVSENDQ